MNIFNDSVDKMINGLNSYQAVAFTDGAYSQNKNKGGYGVVLFTQGSKEIYDKVFRWKTQSHQQIIKLHNVGAECEAVKFIVKRAIEKNLQKITIFYDYEGILKWLTREWNAIQKYRWDNFEHEILFENLSKESADRIEKILIQTFRTQNPDYGYNIQNGGTFGNTAPPEDLTGKQFGRLTVIGRDFSNDKEVRWLCQCSCGNPELVSVSTHTLNRGYT